MERLFALWNQAMQKPWIAKCWQFIKFGIVGVSNTLISLAVYQLALNALGLHYLAANALGLVISVVNAYYWNNRCVFGGDWHPGGACACAQPVHHHSGEFFH